MKMKEILEWLHPFKEFELAGDAMRELWKIKRSRMSEEEKMRESERVMIPVVASGRRVAVKTLIFITLFLLFAEFWGKLGL